MKIPKFKLSKNCIFVTAYQNVTEKSNCELPPKHLQSWNHSILSSQRPPFSRGCRSLVRNAEALRLVSRAVTSSHKDLEIPSCQTFLISISDNKLLNWSALESESRSLQVCRCVFTAFMLHPYILWAVFFSQFSSVCFGSGSPYSLTVVFSSTRHFNGKNEMS